VYLAVARGPSGFNKLVVLKSLRSDFAVDRELLAMFLEEARLAARLNHPHVVQTYEVGEYAGRPVIVMEYLEGQTLANVEQRAKDLMPLTLRLRVLIEALEGLHHAHELADFSGKPLGLVHRDVSPQNVFITFDGHVKVLDFGIAKVVNSQVQTATGILKGKVRYMSPEQMLAAENLDRRADLYSVGVMLWEAVTARRMWQGSSDMQVMTSVCHGTIPSPRTVNPEVSPTLEAICMRALARDPVDRYPTALEMANALETEFQRIGATGATNRVLGQLVRDQFEDVRARTQATIEAQLLEATSSGIESGTQAIPANLVNISTRLSEDSPSGRSGNGSFGDLASTSGPPKKARLAWVVAAAAIGLAAVVGFTALGHTKQAPVPPIASGATAPAVPAESVSSAPAVPPPAPATASAAQPTTVTVALSTTPARASLFLDGRLLPGNPYTATLPLDGAQHRVRAEAPGYFARTVTLAPDHNTEMSIALDPVRGGPPARPAPAPPPPPPASPPPDPNAAARNARCSPPYVVDSDGIKRFRPECLAQ
jgi:serine/threonine-protein kinase